MVYHLYDITCQGHKSLLNVPATTYSSTYTVQHSEWSRTTDCHVYTSTNVSIP